jgi:transcriptional regulator with XRE-family HTH domain
VRYLKFGLEVAQGRCYDCSIMAIGKKIRQLRQTKDWTLADLAKNSKVALSTLSRIETGKMTGTLESHIDIAKALGVRLPELYAQIDPNQETAEVHRGTGSGKKVTTSKGTVLTLLASGSFRKKMLPALLSLSAHKSTSSESGPAEVEKFLYLLQGQLELTVGKEKLSLKAGDSAYFQAASPHTLKNTGSGTAQILVATAPPAA